MRIKKALGILENWYQEEEEKEEEEEEQEWRFGTRLPRPKSQEERSELKVRYNRTLSTRQWRDLAGVKSKPSGNAR